MPPKDVHRSMRLILQIFEELPDKSRASSNLVEMRGLLAGKASRNQGLIIFEAIATALAWRTQQATAEPLDFESPELDHLIGRIGEFEQLYEALGLPYATTFAPYYVEACHRVGRSVAPSGR